MFWLWPIMPANPGAPNARRDAAPERSAAAARRLVSHRAQAARPAQDQNPLANTTRAVSTAVVDTSRDALMRGTTFLSRTFEGLRRLLARFRAVLVHERWMHSAFGWALSPAQRLLPSTAWHLVRPAPAPRRAHGPLDAPFVAASTLADAGFAMWRGALAATMPMLPAPPRYPLLPPPSPMRTASAAAQQATTTMAWLAPMIGLATGMSAWMPASPGLFF